MKNKRREGEKNESGLTRRGLLKIGGLGAVSCALCTGVAHGGKAVLDPGSVQKTAASRLDRDVRVVHSVCLACNGFCGVRGVIEEGKVVNFSGNPYHPYNMNFEPLDSKTPVRESLHVSSSVCGKCLDSANNAYNPYRVLKPLKRSGPRGSGRFEPIEWDRLVREVSEGGRLFSHLGEDRLVEGLRSLSSDGPIDPGAPELGPVRNGFVFMTGRLQKGRQDFIDRFVKQGMGSKNRIGHGDICGLGFRMGNWAFTGQKDVELKADPMNAEYILIFGANIYEATQPGVNTYGALAAKRRSEGALSFSIVDPRATRASAHAKEWVPIKPGQDGALAMGMIRWMIEHDRLNLSFLTAPNQAEAEKRGYGAHCNASFLVVCDPGNPRDGRFLRMKDLYPSESGKAGESMVVIPLGGGKPVSVEDARDAVLDVEFALTGRTGNQIKVKTAFRLMKEGVMEHTVARYAEFCGVPESAIARLASEFTSHGTKAAVTAYHGAGNYVNGTYAAYAIAVLNALVGSVDMRGGYMRAGGGFGSPQKGTYDLSRFPGQIKARGVTLSREKFAYEKTTEFRMKKAGTKSGYPARRPWFPFSKGGLSVETLSGAEEKYPYPCKVLFTYLFNPVYSIPGGYRFKETLGNPEKIPLHVSFDVAVNESNFYADYIVPDLSYLEGHYGWLTPHAPCLNFTAIRTPMIEPLTGRTLDGRPFCTETFLVDVAERIGLPGFGKEAIPDKNGKFHPLHKAEDFYLRGFANIALGAGVPDASPEELAFVEKNYPVARHKDVLTAGEWKKVCYMLARGGLFKKYEDMFNGDKFKHGTKLYAIYNEELAATVDSMSGKPFCGTLKYLPPAGLSGKTIEEVDAEYPFSIVTYKRSLHTQSRSLWFGISMEVIGQNYVEMNEKDAAALGVKDHDEVLLSSRSNPNGIRGRVRLTRLIRPGCLGVSFHFGHTEFGGGRLEVKNGPAAFQGGAALFDADRLLTDPTYRAGLNFNDVARLEEGLANTPMVDLVGGIPDFSSTRVKLKKI
jgi:tetrathionate reductase subunit A